MRVPKLERWQQKKLRSWDRHHGQKGNAVNSQILKFWNGGRATNGKSNNDR